MSPRLGYWLWAKGYGLWAIGYWYLPILMSSGCSRSPSDVYEARGTVELPQADLAALVPAKVLEVRVDEGQAVHPGDTLALLGQRDLDATLAALRARVEIAQANLRDLEAGSRPQEVHQAEAELAAAEAEAVRTRQALERARALVANNAIARQQFDDAVAANRVAEERVSAAREALALARAGSRPERVAAARAQVASARAELQQALARAEYLVLTAPVPGIVLGRHAEPGEALAAGVPVLTVGETGRPYVRVYVPQSLVSGLALGSEVEVVTQDGRTIRGRVAAINPKAEFTPRVALTEQERADLMFGVKVEFLNPAEAPYSGIWVTVRVRRTVGSVGSVGSNTAR
jgi:membrane fusion protein YbhG